MKKTLLMLLAVLMCAFPAIADEDDTELNCDVEVNSDKISDGSKDLFQEHKEAINQFMNDNKWTKATFGTNEKIHCKLLLTLSSRENNKLQGDLQIQSERPVFNSTYTTAVINFRDTKVDFFFESGQHLDFIEDRETPSPADAASFTLLREQINEVLHKLTPKEETLLRLRFGLDDGRVRTLEEVGQHFDITRERIRQIEFKALRKMKHPSRCKKLKDFLDS